ncbi:hypothetical protein Dsin_029462 [Dipteronia sinensis]|uniref:Uncharacterized protein n=1 Tax=Dipteronia sinensis TaxID=43782 RepID=A0AAD9ZTY4_9ROSI|nr:hypothetical protein Dsin_029462 [Dipteronia sinensis]
MASKDNDARQLFNQMLKKDLVTWTMMVGGCADSENANESLVLFDRSPLDTIICDSEHFAEPVNDYCAEKNYNYCAEKNYKTVPKRKPTLPKGRPTTLIDMMHFVSDWFDFEESESVHCDILGSDNMVDCGNITQ